MKNLILSLCALFFSFNSLASAPDFEWKIFETEHFEIFFNVSQRELAKNYAFAAEESYRILSAVFSDLPKKTVVVLDDSTDLTNGAATFLPYDWITIYPALPSPGDTLDEYGYWPTSILVHEYTHIANFQPVGSFYTPFLYLMGRIVTPNMLLPRWYLEGLAVDSESRYTSHGRLRSTRTQGMIRALVQGRTLDTFTVDKINEVEIPTWPFGERPYFFGSLLQKSLVDAGDETLRERWNQAYGRKIPFFINTIPQKEFGKNYAGLLNQQYQNLTEKAEKQIQGIKKQGEFPLTPFQEKDHEQKNAVVSPDGEKLIYFAHSYRREGIWLLERPSLENSFSQSQPKHLINVTSGLRLAWEKDGSGFYFDDIDLDSAFKSYRKIYHYDLDSGKKTRVGRNDLRAQEAVPDPSGENLALIETLADGRHRVALFSLREQRLQPLYTAPLLERLSRPVFKNEHTLLFTQKNLQGKDLLQQVDLRTREIKTLPLPFDDFRNLEAAQGKIFLISHKTGVSAVYAVDEDFKHTAALTNTATWIHDFTLDPSSSCLILSQLTSSGLKLFETPAKNRFVLGETPALVGYTNQPAEPLPTEEDFNEVIRKERSFYPFKYLYPRYWIPFIYPVDGGVLVQGSTSGTDPVGVNQYLLSGSYDSVTGKPSYGFEYLNSSFPVSLSVFASRFQEYLAASELTFEKNHFGASLLAPLGFLSRRWFAGAGYAKSNSQRTSTTFHREGPEAVLTYSNLLDRRFSANGRLFSVSHQKFLSGPDRVAYDRTAFALGQKNSSLFPKDQSLWVGLKGAFSNELPRARLLDFGDRSLGANYLVNLTESEFLYRGYPSGSLVGRQLLNSNIEYRFPIKDIYRGSGTQALFLKSATGVAFVDALAVDGLYYDFKEAGAAYHSTKMSEIHFSTGAELRVDTTVAYHLPLTFIFGGYYGLSRQMGENFSLFIGIGGQDPLAETSLKKDFRHFP